MKIIHWLKAVIASAKDPVKHCKVYKTVGCAHVDGFLCDMRTCTISVTVNVQPNDISEVADHG
jgi:hypothetical protein